MRSTTAASTTMPTITADRMKPRAPRRWRRLAGGVVSRAGSGAVRRRRRGAGRRRYLRMRGLRRVVRRVFLRTRGIDELAEPHLETVGVGVPGNRAGPWPWTVRRVGGRVASSGRRPVRPGAGRPMPGFVRRGVRQRSVGVIGRAAVSARRDVARLRLLTHRRTVTRSSLLRRRSIATVTGVPPKQAGEPTPGRRRTCAPA